MSLCRLWPRRLAWVPLALAGLFGCANSPGTLEPIPAKDDFGSDLVNQPIDETTIGEKEMMHRRARVELLGGAFFPIGNGFSSLLGYTDDSTNHFEVSAMAGLRGDIEVSKNVFLGLSFDWSHYEVDQGVSDILSDPSSATLDQWFESLERYTVLATFEYDTTLARSFLKEEKPLIFRVGLGLGGAIIDPLLDDSLRSTFRCHTFGAAVARPYVVFEWKPYKNTFFFLGTAFDWVYYPNDVEMMIGHDSYNTSGDIDFSAVSLTGGIGFEF